MDNDNLKSLMSEYSRIGIGTLEITPIYSVQSKYRNGHTPINYLSSSWMNALKQVQALGKTDSIQIDMNMGTGWPFGGPMITIKEAAGKLVYTHNLLTTTADAPTITLDVTPQANSDLNLIMAFPNSVKDVSGAFITKQIDTLDITQYVKNNTLTWTPEHPGKYRIIAIYNGHTLQQVKRPAPGGEGYVLDHLDKDAVQKYIKYFEDAFEKAGNPYPTTFFNDSYEIFGADWSPRFFEEFEARRGYKLQNHLQELLNYTTDTNTKVRSDYRETMADMYLDNFIRPWNEFCHQHGVLTRNQSHGSPSNLIDTYASVDIPEIEGYGMTSLDINGLRKDNGFTATNSSDFATLKLASSAAHLTGKQLTSSETFTWLTEHFRTSLSQMKPETDLMFLAGVNRMFFHGTTYSPLDAQWPGWKFYASIDMSPTNSIWEDSKYFMDYVTRCQSFLQWGKPDNDILVYFTCQNSWHTKGTNWLRLCAISDFPSQYSKDDRAVDSLDVYGYGSDYITDKMIETLRYENGEFVTPDGLRYKAMQIPVAANMPEATKARLDSLKALGANVISEKRDESLFNAVAKAEPMRRQLGLRFIRRSNPTGHHYFISNLTNRDVADYVALAVDFTSAVLFNPLDGTMKQALISEDGKVYLNLRSGESVILQTYDYNVSSADLPIDTEADKYTTEDIPLNGEWTLEFNNAKLADNSSYSKTYTLDSPQTWETLDANTAQLMGIGSYTTTVTLTSEQFDNATDFTLSLGDVRESARVYINNEYAGCAWSVPFKLSNLKRFLTAGKNIIRIDVTNLPSNRIRQMDINATPWRIFEDINISTISSSNNVGTTADSFAGWALTPSGLNSTPTLHSLHNSDQSSILNPQSSTTNPASSTTFFSLQGIPIHSPTLPGIYIVNGRKFVVR